MWPPWRNVLSGVNSGASSKQLLTSLPACSSAGCEPVSRTQVIRLLMMNPPQPVARL